MWEEHTGDAGDNGERGDMAEAASPAAAPSMLREIEELGAVTTFDGRHTVHCLTIIGQIEGHYALPPDSKATKYEHVIPQLVAVEQSREVEGLLILLNTVGGDIEAGLALAELVSGMRKPTVSLVLGGGHSIGVPLAVAAKRSLIAPSATMTIHPVRTNGLVLGVPQSFSYFQRMQARIARFVSCHSRLREEDFTRLSLVTDELTTDMGSLLDGEAAVTAGLIDRVGSLADAFDVLYELIDAGKPAQE